MQTFREYLTEATYYLTEGPPAPGNQLFHKDIGIPDELKDGPPAGMRLSYQSHANDRSKEKDITRLPSTVPSDFQLIEVEARQGEPVKWVIRVPYDRVSDMALVVTPSGYVKTVWKNAKYDTHRTLNKSIYSLPITYYRHGKKRRTFSRD